MLTSLSQYTLPLESLPLPVVLDKSDAQLRCHWADGAVRGCDQDLELLASCRTVELHVQGPGDSSPSYAQSLRGEPAPAPPLGMQARGGDGPASAPPGGPGPAAAGTAAFTIVVPCQSLGPWRQLLVRFVGLRGAPSCTLHAARLRGPGGGGTLSAPEPATAPAPAAAPADSAPSVRVSSEGLDRMTVLGGAPGGEQAVGGTPQPAPPEAFPAQPFVTVLPPGPSAAHALVHPSAGASQRQQLREVLRLAAAQQGVATGDTAAPHAGANLHMAAALARSLLLQQQQQEVHGTAGSAAAAGAAREASEHAILPAPPPASSPASAAGQPGSEAAAPGPGPLPAGLVQARGPAASKDPAAPAGGLGFPLSALGALGGLGPLGSFGSLGTALSQIADMSARLQRLEQHLVAGVGADVPGQRGGGAGGQAGGPRLPQAAGVQRLPTGGGFDSAPTASAFAATTAEGGLGMHGSAMSAGVSEALAAALERALSPLTAAVGRVEAAVAAQGEALRGMAGQLAGLGARLGRLEGAVQGREGQGQGAVAEGRP